MSQATMERQETSTPTPTQSRAGWSRAVIITVLLVSLLCTGLTQHVARTVRETATRGNNAINAGGRTTVSGMNSFALALLLGGLRGPLVMILWTSSESQKQEKNLEDFDTKVEMIRLLQPEFDTVHIFQVWNKAYNISVQMSSLYNKYTTILDAIDYGQNVLRARPDNLNMQSAVADVYFNKLGNAAEKQYYRAQVRKESLPHKPRQRLKQNDPGWRRLELDEIVDAEGKVLPKYLRAMRSRPAGLAEDQPFNDGSELQYLKQFEPYTYGVSPFAIAYNYFVQAQSLQRVTHAKHAQTSELVVDSRPAIAMKFWAEEEQELGRRSEMRAFSIPVPATSERLELESPAAVLPLNSTVNDPAKLKEAVYNYERSAELTRAAYIEYQRHLKLFTTNLFTYQSHMDGLTAQEHYCLADAAYLRAMTTQGEERTKWLEVARKEYEETISRYLRITLKFYTDDQYLKAALPNVTREQIDTLPFPVIQQATVRINSAINQGASESHMEDRVEYGTYVNRCIARLQKITP